MTEQQVQPQMDRKDLKIQALLEKISSTVTQYENQVADLRVDYTMTAQENQANAQRVQELEQEVSRLRDELNSVPQAEVVEGSVVSETEEDDS